MTPDPVPHLHLCGVYLYPHRPRCTCDPVKRAAAVERERLLRVAAELEAAGKVAECK